MQTLKKNRSRGARIAASAAVAMSLAVAPVALGAAPAQASTTKASCTVHPMKPRYHHTNAAGVKVLDYRISIKCTKDRKVRIQQRFWEEDPYNPDDKYGKTKKVTKRVDGKMMIHSYRALADADYGDEEVYHDVRFKVGSNGVWTGYTKWENSKIRSIAN
jgi:hypothetical protein